MIDTSKTAKNVDRYLSKQIPFLKSKVKFYKQLESVKSPNLSGMPKSSGFKENDELVKKIDNQIFYEQKLNLIYSAIESCSDQDKILLKSKYIDNKSNFEIMDLLNVQYAQFFRLKKNALCFFAEIYADVSDLRICS